VREDRDTTSLPGDQLVRVLSALANPHRLRILALLAEGRQYVSQVAREVRLSRPLVHMHLKKLEAAGLVISNLELSEEGKAMRYFEIAPFSLALTPRSISEAAATLGDEGEQDNDDPSAGGSK
jgi:DNA-binding transcriptional ArsR family regulator